MANFFKQYKAYFVALVVFLGVAAGFYKPALEGYVPVMHDIQTHRTSSKEIVESEILNGEKPAWTSRLFAGMPTYQISSPFTRWLYLGVYKTITFGYPYPVGAIFLLFLGMFILLRCLKVNPWLSIFASLAFGLSSHFIIILGAGHSTKTLAMAFTPPLIGMFIRLWREKNYLPYAAGFLLFLMLQLGANHLQITYYSIILLLPVGIVELVASFKQFARNHVFAKIACILVATIVAASVSSPNLLMTKNFAEHTIRGKSELTINPNGTKIDFSSANKSEGLDRTYITEYCYGKSELVSYLFPHAVMNPNTPSLGERIGNRQELMALNKAYQQNARKLPSGNRGVFLGDYFGNQTMAKPHYIGIILVYLAILGLLFSSDRLKWSLFGVSILSILLALGKNLGGSIEDMWLTNFFIDNIPLYNKFRAVKMILVLAEISVVVLSMLGIKSIIDNVNNFKKDSSMRKSFLIASGAFVVFVVANLVNPELIAEFFSANETTVIAEYGAELMQSNPQENAVFGNAVDNLKEYRMEGFKSDVTKSLILLLIAIAVLSVFIFKTLQPAVVIGLVGVLVAGDMLVEATNYQDNSKNNRGKYARWKLREDLNLRPVAATAADMQILQQEASQVPNFSAKYKQVVTKLRDVGRIVNKIDQGNAQFSTLAFNTNYRVICLDNPFNDGTTAFFHKNVAGYNPAKLKTIQELIEFHLSGEIRNLNSLEKANVLNMFNTKYIITPDRKRALPNPYAFGNAWSVTKVKEVSSADEEILGLKEVDLKNTAVIRKKYTNLLPDEIPTSSGAKISQIVENYNPEHLVYNFESNQKEVVVFSEIYYEDGWNAYIDGELVDHYQANYILRALTVPEGKHTIEFKFEPTSLASLNMLGNISSVVLLLLLIAGFGAPYLLKRKKEVSDKTA